MTSAGQAQLRGEKPATDFVDLARGTFERSLSYGVNEPRLTPLSPLVQAIGEYQLSLEYSSFSVCYESKIILLSRHTARFFRSDGAVGLA